MGPRRGAAEIAGEGRRRSALREASFNGAAADEAADSRGVGPMAQMNAGAGFNGAAAAGAADRRGAVDQPDENVRLQWGRDGWAAESSLPLGRPDGVGALQWGRGEGPRKGSRETNVGGENAAELQWGRGG